MGTSVCFNHQHLLSHCWPYVAQHGLPSPLHAEATPRVSRPHIFTTFINLTPLPAPGARRRRELPTSQRPQPTITHTQCLQDPRNSHRRDGQPRCSLARDGTRSRETQDPTSTEQSKALVTKPNAQRARNDRTEVLTDDYRGSARTVSRDRAYPQTTCAMGER